MNTVRRLRFWDERLQAAFVRELIRVKAKYTIDEAGSVVFAQPDADNVIDAAHAVRDSQFPWYFMKWDHQIETDRFAALLTKASVPFYLEEHESGTWFLLRREDKTTHERLAERVPDYEEEIHNQKRKRRKTSNQAL